MTAEEIAAIKDFFSTVKDSSNDIKQLKEQMAVVVLEALNNITIRDSSTSTSHPPGPVIGINCPHRYLTPLPQESGPIFFWMAATLLLDGCAREWYQWMKHKGLIYDWQGFVININFRFGPSAYEHFNAKLMKINQS
ncbi:hypothetical protein CFOL_v3_22920 [Cephalotus follicularis]|uniref:Retrotransposon gag domain-containing protein n=1 Tax=Cephalotus follicularis TaxID=3775 RepID=A0A1Q3CGW1_CEPFO|nr:hypothetical protein CFOL_v3_22920 [Cephalotus follicularis]